MRGLVFLALCLALPPAAAAADARDVDALVRDAIGDSTAGSLARYAATPGAAPDRYETPASAARRIVAGGAATGQQPPDLVALQLEDLARTLATSRAIDDRLAAHRARFHARRLVAAVHYHLFTRSLRLAELVAATYGEKDAVAAWRDLVTTAAAARHPAESALRAELKRYELSLKELEEQCCPPDDAVLREKIWQPARAP